MNTSFWRHAQREWRRDWLGNPRADLLAGLVVALALIPEAIAFSIIAGVDPKVGLYASFSIAVLTRDHGRAPGHDLRRHGGDGRTDGDAGQGPRPRVPARRDRTRRPDADRRRAAQARRSDALRLALGHDRLRQRARHPHLHGAAARTHRRARADLRHGRRGPCHHLRAAALHQGGALTAGVHHRLDRRHPRLRARSPHRRRHGRAARHAADVRRAGRTAELAHAHDYRALLGGGGDGWPARVPDDRVDRRRAHRHAERQEPRMHRPGHRQYGDRIHRRPWPAAR